MRPDKRAWSGSKLFDTLMVFLKVKFKIIQTTKNMPNYPACKDLRVMHILFRRGNAIKIQPILVISTSRTPDYTVYSGVHVCWSEHSDLSFVYGFMSLDDGLGTMTATTYLE